MLVNCCLERILQSAADPAAGAVGQVTAQAQEADAAAPGQEGALRQPGLPPALNSTHTIGLRCHRQGTLSLQSLRQLTHQLPQRVLVCLHGGSRYANGSFTATRQWSGITLCHMQSRSGNAAPVAMQQQLQCTG